MATFSETLLSSWAGPPGDAKAQEAYRQVQEALKSNALSTKTVDKYLQGSYRNRTHIRADSDVDVIVELKSTFYYEDKYLSTEEKSLFHKDYPSPAIYGFSEFKNDVYDALVSYFGSTSVTQGKKCIRIIGNQHRSNADVLACQEYRLYTNYEGRNTVYLPGIKFQKTTGEVVINWPKVHYLNGSEKNQSTNQMYKGTVRIFKNLRNLLRDANIIGVNSCPSYFIEGLIFNAPNTCFKSTYTSSLTTVLEALSTADLEQFTCVNKLDRLFGADQWNVEEAKLLLRLIAAMNK